MILRLVKLYVLLLLSGAFVSSEVTFEDGGYRLLVSFSQNIPPEDGENLIESLKTTLQSTSNILRQAIGLQFKKVILKVPQSWNVSEWDITVEDISGQERADILVDNTNDTVFGKLPYANQYGGCYTPGRQIVIPTAFFNDSNDFPKDISLAREWLKYRYGVFDENGFFGDLLYPLFYTIPGSDPNDVKITDCTNEDVTYNFIDQITNENCSTTDKSLIGQLQSKECTVQADEEGLENVVSSLMYFQEKIHTMKYVCGKDSHKHNSNAPNKQNALCYGMSIWDIVKNSGEVRSEDKLMEPINIEYTYVKTKPKVVVAWENTAQLKTKETVILNAIYKFIIDLPLGSQLSTMSFTNSLPDDDFSLHTLNDKDEKNKIISELSSDFVSVENANMNLALEKAIEILKSSTAEGSQPEGNVLIITKTIGTLDDTLLDDLKEIQNINVRILLFSESGIPEEIKKSVSELKNMKVEEISQNSKNPVAFAKLLKTMGEILPSTVDNKETIIEKVQYLSKDSPINVSINDWAETITFWVFSKKQSENFVFKISDLEKKEDEILKGKDVIMSEKFGGSILKMSCTLTQAKYIKLEYPHESEPMLTEVEITSKEGKYFSGEVFVHDTSNKESTSSDQMPVIIYARIRFVSAYPVQNLKVTAKILKPDASTVELDMYDDGKGDPDITKNDGIYSRYFTDFSGKGEYSVQVKVQNNGDSSTFGAYENGGYQTCCGSQVSEGTSKLGTFSKEFKTTFSAKGGKPDGGYKPSRITDLRIHEATNEYISLTWSAPGGEADYGRVEAYVIKYFTSKEAIKEFDQGNESLKYTATPKERGETEIFHVSLSNFEENKFYYIAIRGITKKESDISNIIEIFIPDKKTTDAPDNEKDVSSGNVNQKTIGLIVGLIVGLIILVIIIYLVIYFVVVKPKRQKQKKGKDNPIYEPTTRAENNVLNPISFVSADTLIKHHNEKEKAKLENKEPPVFKEEDFEQKNSQPAKASTASHDDQQPESSNKTSRNEPSVPPKSPKRTTYV